jgi:hypothetical protein
MARKLTELLKFSGAKNAKQEKLPIEKNRIGTWK